MLLRRWERARQGEGQFVHDRRRAGPRQVAPDRGVPHAARGYAAHLGRVEFVAALAEHAAASDRRLGPAALRRRRRRRRSGASPSSKRALAQVKLDPAEYVPLLAPLVDIPLPPERASTLAPEELRRRQMAALLAWVTAGARAQPIVLAFEDLHWADPTTLDVMRGFAERGALAPLLVVATTRPEFRAPWGARSHHGTITLTPLDRAQVRKMVGDARRAPRAVAARWSTG